MKKTILVVMVIVLATSLCISAVACNNKVDEEGFIDVNGNYVPFKPDEQSINVIAIGDGEDFEKGNSYGMPRQLQFLSTTNETESIHIYAIITPDTASNQKVDWVLSWLNEVSDYAAAYDVNDFIEVIPGLNDSASCDIKCLLPFLESEPIVLKVITRDGRFEDSCFITFVGVPTSLDIETGLVPVHNGGTVYNVELGNNRSYIFDINLSNNFGQVGSSFNNFEVFVDGYGLIDVQEKKVTVSQEPPYPKTTERVGEISLVNVNTLTDYIIKSANVIDGKLHITTGDLLETYYSEKVSGYLVTRYKDCYLNDRPNYGVTSYFAIRVKELNSGITGSFSFYLVTGVQNVAFSQSTYEI